MHDDATTGSDAKVIHTGDTNGASEQHQKAAGQHEAGSQEEARRQAAQRAEELVDRWGEQIGQYAAQFGHNVLKWAARAREEAEDIWAEAQALRERQRNQKD